MLSERRSRPRPENNNLSKCGFVCTACLFQMRLCDLHVVDSIIACFKAGMPAVNITCPECGQVQDYCSSDLKVFLPGGKQMNMARGKSVSA